MKVVAFTGKRGSGKSAAAQILCEHAGFVDLKFADPLKNMLRAMYATCGVDSIEIERKIEGDLKEVPCPWLCGKTPRFAMQTLGTEWRELISTDMWSEMLKRRVRSGVFGDKIVCSDYRFPHEGIALAELGAETYRVQRDSADVLDTVTSHISEAGISSIPVSGVIDNNGSLEEFKDRIVSLVSS